MATRSETLKQIIKVEGVREAGRDIDSMKGSIDSSNQSLVTMALKFASVGLATKLISDSYKAFIVQRDAVTGVNIAIQNMGFQADLTSEQVGAVASKLQSLSNYGDEETLGTIFQPLINAGIKSADILDKVGLAIADVSAGTGKSIDSMSEQIVALISGAMTTVTQLAKSTGISQDILKKAIDGTSSATERAINLAEILGSKFKGSAEASADPVKQLQNTLGDLKEEFGRALYPAIKSLAGTAKSFLENKDNVDSLISGIKVLAIGFTGIQGVNLMSNIGMQFIGIKSLITGLSKSLGDSGGLSKKILELNDAVSSSQNGLSNLAKEFKNTNLEVNKHGELTELGVHQMEGLSSEYSHQETIVNKNTASLKELNTQQISLNKSIFTSVSSIAKVGASLLGYIGIAYSAFVIIKQVGEAFGWWGKKVEDVTSKLEEQKKVELGRRQVFKDSLTTARDLLSINNRTVAENKNLSATLNDLKSGYGITIGLEEDRATALKRINDELETQKSFNSAEGVTTNLKKDIADTEALLANSTKMMKHWGTFKLYETTDLDKVKAWFKGSTASGNLSQQGKWFKDEEKLVAEYTLKLEELKNQLELLNNTSGGSDSIIKPKDISALSKYYEMVKFADSDYYEWKKNINNNLAKAYKDELKNTGYSEKEANDISLKYARELNAQLLSDKMDYYEALSKARQQNSSIDNMVINPIETYDMSEYYAYLEKQKSAISAYYDTVGDADKTYYDYKKALAKEDVENQLANNLISQEQANLLLETKLNNLTKETEAYQNYASIAESAINSLSSTLTGFIKISTDGQSKIQQLWKNMANAIIAEISRIITKMIVMWVLKQALNLVTGGASGVTGGALPIGTGEGLPFSGGFASFPTSPIGIGSSNITPNVNTNRNNDTGIIDKLNEVIYAINVNSIRDKITTINRVDLAKEVEAGNMERSVF